jgi:uncharacterized protein (DUF433 family)
VLLRFEVEWSRSAASSNGRESEKVYPCNGRRWTTHQSLSAFGDRFRYPEEGLGILLAAVGRGQRAHFGKGETKMGRLDRITVDVTRMNGEPCIRDLRLTVRRVLEALAMYPERAELKREYPELEDEDIRQALAFAAALVDDKVLPLPGAR